MTGNLLNISGTLSYQGELCSIEFVLKVDNYFETM